MAKKSENKRIAEILSHIAELLEINSVAYKPAAYRRAAKAIEELEHNIAEVYKKDGLKGLDKISGVGKSISAKLEEYLKKKKIKFYEELKEKTALREIVTHFFKSKDIPLQQLKLSARKERIMYGRYAKAAADLLEMAGSVKKAKQGIDKVADWANSRKLDYTIETVTKKWLELDRLKPKKKERKAFYENMPMIWVEDKKKWFVITPEGEWLEFAGEEKDIEYREE